MVSGIRFVTLPPHRRARAGRSQRWRAVDVSIKCSTTRARAQVMSQALYARSLRAGMIIPFLL